VPLLVVAALALVVVVSAGGLYVLMTRQDNGVSARPASASAGVRPATASAGSPAASTAGHGEATAPADAAAGSAGDAASPSRAAGDGPSPSARGAAAFAPALNGLLDESAAARTSVSATVAALQACRTPAAKAAASLRAAGKARTALATRAAALDPAGVPRGKDAVSAFMAMQDASSAADDSFAQWADDIAVQGCRTSAPRTMNWALGNQHSGEATAAKARFVALWNPIATTSGLARRTTDGI
jgi:hypothetical protein